MPLPAFESEQARAGASRALEIRSLECNFSLPWREWRKAGRGAGRRARQCSADRQCGLAGDDAKRPGSSNPRPILIRFHCNILALYLRASKAGTVALPGKVAEAELEQGRRGDSGG